MNAVTFRILTADFDDRAQAEAEARDSIVAVVSFHWLGGSNQPPHVELKLSDGRFVKVGWDGDYAHKLLAVAADKSADYADCTGIETGLEPGELEVWCDRAHEAWESWARECDEGEEPTLRQSMGWVR